MKSLTLMSLAALAVGGSASALKPRNISNNNCGRAVAGTAQGPAYQSTAKKDCSSRVIAYTTTTITPAASYDLHSNVQATASSTSIIINTGSTTGTSDILSTETDHFISTAYSTSTDVQTLTIIQSSTPPATTITIGVTVTATPSSTVTSYYATVTPAGAAGATVTIAPPRARAVQEQEEQVNETRDANDEDCEIEERAAATTSKASSGTVPAYASACTNFAQYVLACSLIGVYQTTSTISSILPASTITVTTFSTLTTTLVQTATTEVDLSFTTFETLVSTTTQSATFVIPAVTTSIVTAYTTQIASASTVSIYETTTVSAPASVSTVTAPLGVFKLEMTPTSGTGATYYMQIIGSSLGFTGTTDVNAAMMFTLDTAGRLITTAAAPVVACAYNSLANYYMEAIPYAYLDAHASTFTALKCSVSSGLVLTCAYNSANTFEYVPSQNSFWYTTPGYYTSNYPPYIANVIPV